MESIFSFFFKYRPLLFLEGDIVFRSTWPVLLLVLVAGGAIALAAASYARSRGKTERADRIVLAVLRVGVFGVLFFALLRPTLALTSTVPQRNFLGVLVDDSRSMTLPGSDGEPRSAFVEDRFDPEWLQVLLAIAPDMLQRLP